MNTKPNETPPAPVAGSAVSKRYRVHGYCFVPTECVMTVAASSPEEAVRIALASRWKDHIDQNGGDEGAAFDWQPDAQEIGAPNPEPSGPNFRGICDQCGEQFRRRALHATGDARLLCGRCLPPNPH